MILGDVLLIGLLFAVIATGVALYWHDVVVPRSKRSARRRERRELRRQANWLFQIWLNLHIRPRTRRLTDQRPVNPDIRD
ncbi:MAG: hypothetical protein KGM17_04505 [Sphingomonadales bacterium]|nr:hypothetical protein [Sphingomonadales bacterium]